MHTALSVASQCTASMACLAAAMYSPRFQTRLTGVFSGLAFAALHLPMASCFAILSVCLMFSTWLSFTKPLEHPSKDWALFTGLVLLDLTTKHAFLPLELGVLCVYALHQGPFPYSWRAWSLSSVLVYMWPGLAFGWIPIGFSMTAVTERYILLRSMINKKII